MVGPLQLLCTTASPFSAKVRMAAAYAGIELELVSTDAAKEPIALMQANPLGKIPVLLTEDFGPLSDSRVITQYLDRLSGGRLFPADWAARTQAERLEALGDGLCDALQAHVYERRFRPENMVSQVWLDRQWGKVERTLRYLEQIAPPVKGTLHVGQIALRTSLGYLHMRFAGQPGAGNTGLGTWVADFDNAYPELKSCLPKAP